MQYVCVHLRRCLCICGYGLPPRPLRSNNILKIHRRKCVCVCADYRVPFSLCCHPIWLFRQILKQFSLMSRSNPYAHTWSLTYHIYNQALTHAKFLWSTHHTTSFTHASAFFYLSHSISISILSQESRRYSFFSLQKWKDMTADNKPLKKEDDKQPLLLWLKNLPRT